MSSEGNPWEEERELDRTQLRRAGAERDEEKGLHCVTERNGHSLNSWECMEAEARRQEREGETLGGRKRLYSQEIFIMYFLIVHSVYISVLGHQQVATSSHELYKCLIWTINIDTLILMLI